MNCGSSILHPFTINNPLVYRDVKTSTIVHFSFLFLCFTSEKKIFELWILSRTSSAGSHHHINIQYAIKKWGCKKLDEVKMLMTDNVNLNVIIVQEQWASKEERRRGSVGNWVELLKIGRTLSSSRAEVGGRRQTDGQSFCHGRMLRLSDSWGLSNDTKARL